MFSFDQSGLAGQITDPPETQLNNYVAEWPKLIRQAYATVLDPLFENTATEIGGNYIGIEFLPGWKFGIHSDVYSLVRDVKDAKSASQLLTFLSNFTPAVESSVFAGVNSVGTDGHILIGRSRFSEEVWSKEIA